MDWSNPLIYIIPGLAALSGIIYLSRWMGTKDEFAKNVGEAINEMRADVKELLRMLPESPATKGKSPLSLTEVGESISETLGANAWAKRTAPSLAPQFKNKPPYDIQEFCMNYVRYEFKPTPEFIEKMKSCAYEKALPMSQVEDVLAVELRDAILTILAD